MSRPNPPITKYFFGYFNYHGKHNATSWVEYDGIPVGSVPAYTQKHEITEREWETSTISSLKVKYPPNSG